MLRGLIPSGKFTRKAGGGHAGMAPWCIEMKTCPGHGHQHQSPLLSYEWETQKFQPSITQFYLHRFSIGLFLPAIKGGSIIGTQTPPSRYFLYSRI